jgi:hypothetical protein
MKCHTLCSGSSSRWPQLPQYLPGTLAPQLSQSLRSGVVATAAAATSGAGIGAAAVVAGAAAPATSGSTVVSAGVLMQAEDA